MGITLDTGHLLYYFTKPLLACLNPLPFGRRGCYTTDMPVRKDSEENGEAKYTINNGDLQALNRIKDQYGLEDTDDVIVFAIGLLSQSNGRAVAVTKDDGSTIRLLPSDELKKKD
jgi:hypothetical protein